MASVIVFGPTGKIGSVAALTAAHNGAKVYLAMRDPAKAIPDITGEPEGQFERVTADLTKPDSVAAAVKKTGAKRAFIYAMFGSQDHMKAALEALKSAGIEFVVFISSCSVLGDPRDVIPSEAIPYIHGQVEINLDDIFGPENYVAVRPGYFASNVMRYKAEILKGEVKLFGPKYTVDCITPEDIGRVSGTILAQGKARGSHRVYLYGPQIISQTESLEIIGQVLGKDIKILETRKQEALDQFMSYGADRPTADYMVDRLERSSTGTLPPRTSYEEGVQAVQMYTGKPAIGFRQWVEANKAIFSP